MELKDQNGNPIKIQGLIFGLAIIGSLLVFILISFLPGLASFRSGLTYRIFAFILMSFFLVLFTFFETNHPATIDRVLVFALSEGIYTAFLIAGNSRIVGAIALPAGLLILLYGLLFPLFGGENRRSWAFLYAIALLLLPGISLFHTQALGGGFYFWKPSLIVACIVAPTSILLALFKPDLFQTVSGTTEKARQQARIAGPIILIVFSFALSEFACYSANVVFDQSVGAAESYAIKAKHSETNSDDNGETYYFTLKNVERTFDYQVDYGVYSSYQVGDNFDLFCYSGALGVAYVTPSNV